MNLRRPTPAVTVYDDPHANIRYLVIRRGLPGFRRWTAVPVQGPQVFAVARIPGEPNKLTVDVMYLDGFPAPEGFDAVMAQFAAMSAAAAQPS